MKEDGTLEPNLSVQSIFSSWSGQAGYPLLTVHRNYENGSITISQERYMDNRFDPLINATTWWIPYHFASAKSSSFNGTTPEGWLPQHQRTKLIEPSGDNEWASNDWIVFNKQMTGYYRVMYDTKNWKLINAQLNSGPNNKIHPSNRVQLVDDTRSFVETGRLPRNTLIEMVNYLKHETEYAPWVAGSKALLYLDHLLGSTEEYYAFRSMAESIIESAVRRLNVRIEKEETYSLMKTRKVVNKLACQLDLKTCVFFADREMDDDDDLDDVDGMSESFVKRNFKN